MDPRVNGGTAAFPDTGGSYDGLTKREWMATTILAGMLPSRGEESHFGVMERMDSSVTLALAAADLLLERLGQ